MLSYSWNRFVMYHERKPGWGATVLSLDGTGRTRVGFIHSRLYSTRTNDHYYAYRVPPILRDVLLYYYFVLVVL